MVDTLAQDLRASERMAGVERIWVPGEQSEARRVLYAAEGIPIASALRTQLDTLAEELGIAPLGA